MQCKTEGQIHTQPTSGVGGLRDTYQPTRYQETVFDILNKFRMELNKTSNVVTTSADSATSTSDVSSACVTTQIPQADTATAHATTSAAFTENSFRKQKEMRLTNRIHSPVSIKIEDDSDEETISTVEIPFGNPSSDCVDKSVQTENILLVETLKKVVKQRMKQYEAAAIDEKCIDKQLAPLLEKLQKENDDLRRQGLALRLQLEHKEKEKQTLKRRFGAIENVLKETSPTSTPSCRPPTYSTSGVMRANQTNVPRLNSTRTLRLPPPLQPPQQPSSSHGMGGNTVSFQQPINIQRPPVHMVNPVRQHQHVSHQMQPMMRHQYAPSERFILYNNQLLPVSVSGVNNTQVVASNQGLRMTSIPPDVNLIRSPIDTPTRTYTNVVHSGVSSDQYKQLHALQHQHQQQRMPGNTGLRPTRPPVQNTVRPFNQPRLQQPAPSTVQQNVPNIALPFSPLPKLTANISTSNNAIVLTWDYEKSGENTESYKVECYQLFAHQAKDARVKPPLDTKQWKKIGVVNALPLPMACTLTQFASGSVYFFAVVAVDIHGREGEMSNPCVIRLDVNR